MDSMRDDGVARGARAGNGGADSGADGSVDIVADRGVVVADARDAMADARHGRAETRSLDDDIGFQLVRASTTATRRMRAALKPIGLRARTFSALALAVVPGALGQRELAARLLLDPSQIVPVVDELEQLGLVERTVDPADRRGRLVSATPKGIAMHAEARRRIDDADPGDAADLSPAEREVLLGLLHRISGA